jgi:hypothetical protein
MFKNTTQRNQPNSLKFIGFCSAQQETYPKGKDSKQLMASNTLGAAIIQYTQCVVKTSLFA